MYVNIYIYAYHIIEYTKDIHTHHMTCSLGDAWALLLGHHLQGAIG